MVSKDLQMEPKLSPGDPKRSQKSTQSNPRVYSKQICTLRFYPLISILEISFSIPANPCSLQISSQLVARGAGGRGEALRYQLLIKKYFKLNEFSSLLGTHLKNNYKK